jgi:hypothetical protein
MANPEENTQHDRGPPDGRPRRQPPTIDVAAVEVSPDGSDAAAAAPGPTKQNGASRWPTRLAVIGSIGAVVAVVAGTLWIYAAPDRPEAQQRDAVAYEAAKLDATRLDATKLDDVEARLATLESTLNAAPAQAAPDAALANRVGALEAAAMPLAARVTEVERRVRDNTDAVRHAGERADAVAGLLDELKSSGAEQSSLAQQQRSTLEGFADRLKALEALLATLKSAQDEIDSAARAPAVAAPDTSVRVAVIAAALRNAVERDYPFTAELAAARTLGLDDKALAALEPFAATGVPSQNEVFRGLSALVPELLRVSAPAGRDGGYLDRLQASATKMLNIRPAGDVPGDDPANVIGRIELKMVRQDVAGVAAELDKLPVPAKELAQPWRNKALARQAAVEAARRIATAAIAKLGEPAAPEPSSR